MIDLRTTAICVAALCVAITPSSASAADIVYLECGLPSGSTEVLNWNIALDESAKTVSFEHSLGSGTRPATFTADKVSWNNGRFTISRVDLTISREALGKTDTGKCKVVDAPKRAF